VQAKPNQCQAMLVFGIQLCVTKTCFIQSFPFHRFAWRPQQVISFLLPETSLHHRIVQRRAVSNKNSPSFKDLKGGTPASIKLVRKSGLSSESAKHRIQDLIF